MKRWVLTSCLLSLVPITAASGAKQIGRVSLVPRAKVCPLQLVRSSVHQAERSGKPSAAESGASTTQPK